MVMTLKDHADIAADGALSPYQARVRAIKAGMNDAARVRDREERRRRRLTLALIRCEARLDCAQLAIVAGMEELRGMRA